jgi:hypothetical protein
MRDGSACVCVCGLRSGWVGGAQQSFNAQAVAYVCLLAACKWYGTKVVRSCHNPFARFSAPNALAEAYHGDT